MTGYLFVALAVLVAVTGLRVKDPPDARHHLASLVRIEDVGRCGPPGILGPPDAWVAAGSGRRTHG